MKRERFLMLVGFVCLVLVLATMPILGACAKPAPSPAPAPAPAPTPPKPIKLVVQTYLPPGDGTALAKAIVRLLKDAALRQRMGRAGRERAYSCFTADRIVSETLAVYHRVLASSAARTVPAAIKENG